MNIYYNKIVLLVCFLTNFTMFSQVELKKQINETFSMTNAGELHIDNKYGDVIINGWEENSISITIDIMVTNKKKDNAESLLERIVPNIKSTSNYVEIISEISEKNTNLFFKYFNKVNPFDFDKSNVDINYTINLPINSEINVINKFGDVVLDNWTGKLKANIQHGDLWINESLTNADIDVKYGNLKAKSLDYATIILKNGKLIADNSKKLLLKADGSIIEMLKVDMLELHSSKDDISIEKIGTLDGYLNFTNMSVKIINSDINLNMKISEFCVDEIIQKLTNITIKQESSEVAINIKNLSFKFKATLEQGVLRLPRACTSVNTKLLDKGKRVREISASYGNALNGSFIIKGKKGIITLKE